MVHIAHQNTLTKGKLYTVFRSRRPRFRQNQALWAKNTDADGFGICSPLVFDRSAEQIGRKPICPNLIGTGSSLIYQTSYLFLNRNQSRIGPRRRQNHKAWPEIWTRTGTDPGLVPVFVKTIRNGLKNFVKLRTAWLRNIYVGYYYVVKWYTLYHNKSAVLDRLEIWSEKKRNR